MAFAQTISIWCGRQLAGSGFAWWTGFEACISEGSAEHLTTWYRWINTGGMSVFWGRRGFKFIIVGVLKQFPTSEADDNPVEESANSKEQQVGHCWISSQYHGQQEGSRGLRSLPVMSSHRSMRKHRAHACVKRLWSYMCKSHAHLQWDLHRQILKERNNTE